jgi:hypothetical protein
VWRSAAVAVGWLTAIILAVWVVVLAVVFPAQGWAGGIVAAAAAGVCWLSSVFALIVTVGLARSEIAMVGALGGIVFRTGGPLAAMAAGTQVPWLAQHGFAGLVVVFFLVSLVAETILATWVSSRALKLSLWR